MFNAGTPAATITNGSATIPQVLVQGGSISARIGDTIKIPIMVSAITDAENVRSYDFVATFDKSIINITSSDLAGTLSESGTPAINVDNTTGTVRFAWASSNRIITTSEVTLLNLTGTAVGIGTTNLNFTSFEVNQGTPLASANPASITVKIQNFTPTLTLSPAGTSYIATDGVQLKITLIGADQNPEDVASLAYSISAPATLPAGIVLTGNVFTWTPTVAQRSVNPYSFTFMVKDQGGLSSTQTVTVTVTQNYAPTLTLSPVGPNYTTTDGVELKITLNGADQNPTDVPLLQYSITAPSTLPTGATLTGNVFSWTPIFTQRSVNPYSFTFQVKDQLGLTATQTVRITVTQNYAPTLTLSPVGPNYSAADGVELKITLIGADLNPSDVASLKYSISAPATLPAGVVLTGNVFTWTPTVTQRSVIPYSFTLKVMDQDSAFATKTVTVTVAQNVAPTLTLNPAGPNYTVNEGVLLSITLVGADQNPGDVALLQYSVSTDPAALPAGAKLTANVFSWTPAFDQGRTAPYGFIFKVTDPFGASAFSTVGITVVNVDRAPVFTKVPDYVIFPVNIPTPLVSRFQYVATDPDGDKVYYSLLSGPAGSNVDTTGLFTWGPTIDQVGHIYTVTVQATDGQLSTTTTQYIAASDITDVQKLNDIPTVYSLSQNYPNPFNPTTFIQFGIPKEGFVKLSVFNVIGQEIKVLVNENMSAGNYKINFDASKLNSGMYLYRIETKNYTSVKKMLLVK
jgi:hypothetical protein